MANHSSFTDDQPTKDEILEALSENGIINLEDLVDALMPETGGYAWHDRDDDPPGLEVAKLKTGSINVHWHSGPGVFDPFVIKSTRDKLVASEDTNMAAEKPPTRDEIMEELSKKGINNLIELLDALMPDETGGYNLWPLSEENLGSPFSLGNGMFKLRGHLPGLDEITGDTPARAQDVIEG